MDAIRRDAEEFARQIEVQTGVRLDFDLPSLSRFDALLAEWIDLASVYDALDTSEMDALVRPLAGYVGETLVSSLGAAWEPTDVAGSSLPRLRFSTGQTIDLEEAFVTILHGRARPAFHDLAMALLGETPEGASCP